MNSSHQPNFDITGKTVVVTNEAGVLCAAICRSLAQAGAKVAVLDLNSIAAEQLAAEICNRAISVACNALDSERLPANRTQAQHDYFGTHTYRRTDREGVFHTEWTK